jgi:hypothetical protein
MGKKVSQRSKKQKAIARQKKYLDGKKEDGKRHFSCLLDGKIYERISDIRKLTDHLNAEIIKHAIIGFYGWPAEEGRRRLSCSLETTIHDRISEIKESTGDSPADIIRDAIIGHFGLSSKKDGE